MDLNENVVKVEKGLFEGKVSQKSRMDLPIQINLLGIINSYQLSLNLSMESKPRKFKKKVQDNSLSEATIKNPSYSKTEYDKKKESSNFQVSDFDDYSFEPRIAFKEYSFKHTFNEYVRMALMKILPYKKENSRMTIDRDEQILRGPPEECQKLKRTIKKEIQEFTMKMIRFYSEEDIDEIEFHLNPDYEIKVYRIKYVELAAKKVAQDYNYNHEAVNLIEKMKKEKQILIRILKQFSEMCLNDINQIVNKSKESLGYQNISMSVGQSMISSSRGRSHLNDSGMTNSIYYQQNNSSSSSSIKEEEDQPSYYDQVARNSQICTALESKPKVEEVKKRSTSEANKNLLGKLAEPTEDDSVSVVEEKKKGKNKKKYQMKKSTQHYYEEEPKIQKKMKEIKKYEIEQGQFDQKDFKEWRSNKRNNSKDEIKIQRIPDPYDDKSCRFIVKLLVEDGLTYTSQGEKIEALDFYFKFKKVLFIRLKNDVYKKQLIEQYTKDDENITVEYIKGFKSPKWKENTMWNHIMKKNYSEEKKSANTEYFQAFFLQGIRNLVMDLYDELSDKLRNEPKDDIVEQIMFTHDEIADHLRDNEKVKNILKKHVETTINDSFRNICKIKETSFVLTSIKISLFIKFNQQGVFHRQTKEQIINKLTKELKIQQFQNNFVIDKFTYEKLDKNLAILQKQEKKFTFVCSQLDLSDCYNKIHSIINSVNVIEQSEIKVDDILIGKQIHENLKELKSNNEFEDIKFHSASEEGIYVFKFYGRGYILESIQEKIQKYKEELLQKRMSYYQMVKPKEKQIFGQDFIDTIHEKYNILLTPQNSVICCSINLVKQDESFKKKVIMVKKCKTLDHAPCGSVILFRSMNQMDSFEGQWTKTYKNFAKKHNQNVPFNEKSRNYTIMIKSNASTKKMLKETLDQNAAIDTVVMIMQSNDKHLLITQLATLLVQEKHYKSRSITILLLEKDETTNMKKILDIEQYSKNKKPKAEEKVETKYYVTDGQKRFYYSATGNKKIEEAIKNKEKSVILNNEDLNITHCSHKFFNRDKLIQHLQSSNTFPVTINRSSSVTFTLKGKEYEMPKSEAKSIQNAINLNISEVEVSLGVYEIDLGAWEQINLFSGYARKLHKDETITKIDKIVENMQVFYDVKMGEIVYQYSSDSTNPDSLTKTLKQVKDFLNESIKVKEISLKHISNLSKDDLTKLIDDIEEEQAAECTYDEDNQNLTVKCMDENDINRTQWRIKVLESTYSNVQIKEQVKFPDCWEAQKDDIQQFVVPEGSAEFMRVQDLFKVAKIRSLVRIQNKIIYKKYYEEGLFLKSQNDGTAVKKMELFHGTRGTNPEEIYKDKEECFNINYSSDSNLLGRGIYFAERSQYSNSYRYTEEIETKTMFGLKSNKTNVYSMFLCEVYVGQSEKCPGHNGAIKDTSFRDKDKKVRFESMTDFLNNSNIYVVYKSRRAYPSYLIRY